MVQVEHSIVQELTVDALRIFSVFPLSPLPWFINNMQQLRSRTHLTDAPIELTALSIQGVGNPPFFNGDRK
jgi:hypothetical protein